MKTKSMRSSARSAVLVTALAAAVLAPPTAASATPVTHSGDSPVIAADGLHHSLGSSSQTVGTATWHQEHVAAGGALARARFLLTGSGADAARMVAAPAAWARSGNQGTAYVTNAGSDSVTPIRTAANTAGTPIKVGSIPVGIAITPNGTTAYVANADSNTVTPIRTAANTAGTPIKVGSLSLIHI